MPKTHGKRTRVYLNGYDVSAYFNTAETSLTAEAVEASGFTEEEKVYVVGQRHGTMRLAGQFDNDGAAGVEKRLWDVLPPATNPIVSIVSADAADAGGWSAEDIETAFSVSSPVAGVVAMNADFTPNGAPDRTRTVAPKGTITTATAALASYNGGGSTVQGLTGYLHVFSVLGGTPVFVIEGSDNGTSGWTTMLSFAGVAAAGAPQAQKVDVSGTIKPYLRANVSSGSAVAFIAAAQPIG